MDDLPYIEFPSVDQAEEDGLLCWGGDLLPHTLVSAYKQGIFPWYNPTDPILWWSPDPRFVLFPQELHLPKSIQKVISSGVFQIGYDGNFTKVMEGCAKAYRPGQGGTWIGPDMIQAYTRLHELGYGHSVEVFSQGKLAGGLYGLALGKIFFGESMFFSEPNASKVGFVHLVKKLQEKGYQLLDSQMHTPHVQRFGARNIPREQYLDHLKEALLHPGHLGSWASWGKS